MRSRGREIAVAEWVVGRAFRAVLRTTMSFGCHIEDRKDLVFRIRTSSTGKEKIVMCAKLLDFDIIAKTFGPSIFRTHKSLRGSLNQPSSNRRQEHIHCVRVSSSF